MKFESEGKALEIKIRPFIPSDWESVELIEKAAVRFVTPITALLGYYKVFPEDFVVAEMDDKVVGYAVGNTRTLRDGSMEGHILDIAVDPACRGQGVGKLLVDHLIDSFRKQGLKKLGLEVKTNNIGAKDFYSRLGFNTCYIHKGYYRGRGYTEDAVIMRKDLDGHQAGQAGSKVE